MVPRSTVNPYTDYSDPIAAEKRRELGYGMESERSSHIEEYIHLCCHTYKKCQPIVSTTATLVRATHPPYTASAKSMQ